MFTVKQFVFRLIQKWQILVLNFTLSSDQEICHFLHIQQFRIFCICLLHAATQVEP
jgi:hypothetical protein